MFLAAAMLITGILMAHVVGHRSCETVLENGAPYMDADLEKWRRARLLDDSKLQVAVGV